MSTKVATIEFTENASESLTTVLKSLVGHVFNYDDQDGNHLVVLTDIVTAPGLVKLQDLNKRTKEPIRHPYVIDLYTDGVLTHL